MLNVSDVVLQDKVFTKGNTNPFLAKADVTKQLCNRMPSMSTPHIAATTMMHGGFHKLQHAVTSCNQILKYSNNCNNPDWKAGALVVYVCPPACPSNASSTAASVWSGAAAWYTSAICTS